MPLDWRSFWNGLTSLPDVAVPGPAAPLAAQQASLTGAGTPNLAAAADEAAQGSSNAVDCTTGTCPDCRIITGAMLADVYDQASAAERDIAARELNRFINRGQLDSELRLAHFLGQTRQETAGRILRTENLNYAVAVLKVKFGYYARNPRMAEAHGRRTGQAADQVAIANHAYGDRIGNGSIASGDGWRFRGRGIKQLTGRENYRNFTIGHRELWLEDVDFEANPDLVSEDARYAVRSGIWFWLNHDLGMKADRGGTRAAADAISTVVNRWDGDVGFTNRYNYMRAILDAGTFEDVCFNKSTASRNREAWHPFGNNGR